MNDAHLFSSRKEEMIILLNAGLPMLLIANRLGISESTCSNYLRKLRDNNEWNGKPISFIVSIPTMFSVLADIVYNKKPSFDYSSPRLLKESLWEVLDVDYLIKALDVFARNIQVMGLYAFDESVPIEYRKFVNTINPFSNDHLFHDGYRWRRGKEIFDDFLRGIYSGKKKFIIKDRLSDWTNIFIDEAVKDLSIEMRKWIKPVFDENIVKRVDKALGTLTDREQEIVRMYLGLNTPKLPIDEIGSKLDLSSNRVLQIKEKAFRRIRHQSRLEIIFSEREKVEKLVIINGTKVSDLDFSIMCLRALEINNIEFLESLCVFTEEYVARYFRHIGRRSLDEIKAMLEKHNLHFKKE